jgi:hypothetical protein
MPFQFRPSKKEIDDYQAHLKEEESRPGTKGPKVTHYEPEEERDYVYGKNGHDPEKLRAEMKKRAEARGKGVK